MGKKLTAREDKNYTKKRSYTRIPAFPSRMKYSTSGIGLRLVFSGEESNQIFHRGQKTLVMEPFVEAYFSASAGNNQRAGRI